ncbi:hypothetical protein EVG20_g11214 [Dentipellis fragilis]|uniref:Uncharacterized protein n=1 Tax=Dentipellis fragilis TaxID=205917 RepID=A0A4Y9XL55_9AGAM|nr:hypothetical protein EVG20_g11214 [Dentipellis fragilis]
MPTCAHTDVSRSIDGEMRGPVHRKHPPVLLMPSEQPRGPQISAAVSNRLLSTLSLPPSRPACSAISSCPGTPPSRETTSLCHLDHPEQSHHHVPPSGVAQSLCLFSVPCHCGPATLTCCIVSLPSLCALTMVQDARALSPARLRSHLPNDTCTSGPPPLCAPLLQQLSKRRYRLSAIPGAFADTFCLPQSLSLLPSRPPHHPLLPRALPHFLARSQRAHTHPHWPSHTPFDDAIAVEMGKEMSSRGQRIRSLATFFIIVPSRRDAFARIHALRPALSRSAPDSSRPRAPSLPHPTARSAPA